MCSLNETLLASWIKLSTTIVNEKLVSDMPYNDSLVCHILYRNMQKGEPTQLTATDLCERTHILKSQMNRILNRLEEQEFIKRIRSLTDKRQVYITFNLDKADLFKRQHEKILKILDSIIEDIGIDKAEEAADLFNRISKAAHKVLT